MSRPAPGGTVIFKLPAAAPRLVRHNKLMAQPYDAVIVGGGHNGLVTAAYLARAGRKVLVLERRELVGGCAVTEEIWPGYRVSTAAYLDQPACRSASSANSTCRASATSVDAKDPAFFSPFPDGRHFFMWQDRASARWKRSRKFSAARRRRLSRLRGAARTPLAAWSSRCCSPRPRTSRPSARAITSTICASARACVRARPRATSVALVKIFTQSVAEFLDEWFESAEAEGHAGHRRRDRRQRRPALARHRLHPAAPLHGRRGRPARPVGLRARRHGRGLRSHRRRRRAAAGAAIRTGAPKSSASWCARAACAAWCSKAARRSTRRVVASNLDPNVTFLRLLDESDLDPEFARRHPPLPHRGHLLQDQPGALRPARVHGPARRARPAAPRHHAHLPVDRVRRARLGRRQVRPPLANARCSS